MFYFNEIASTEPRKGGSKHEKIQILCTRNFLNVHIDFK